MEGGWQVHLILLTPEGAQGFPHGGCPEGEDPQTCPAPAGPRMTQGGVCDWSLPFPTAPSTPQTTALLCDDIPDPLSTISPSLPVSLSAWVGTGLPLPGHVTLGETENTGHTAGRPSS